MTPIVDVLLLLAAVVSFGLATFGVAARVNLVALGLLLAFLVPLIHAAQSVP